MPKGEYRDSGGWVLVNYEGRFHMPMHRSDYEDHGYRPLFEALPLRSPGPKGGALKNGAVKNGAMKNGAMTNGSAKDLKRRGN